jgi:hypothetical protein
MTFPSFSVGETLRAADMNAVGLWKVSPTSATNGTVSDGVVTIGNAVASVTVNGAFSTDYDSYEIVYSMGDSSAVAALFVKFNNSTGSTYSYGGGYTLFGTTSFVAEQANNTSDGIRIGNSNVDLSSIVFQVVSPFSASPTHVMAQHADHQYFSVRGGRDSNAASQTGFTLVAPGATLTGGTIRIYGRRK